MKGPDHKASANPKNSSLVKQIRNLELALGIHEKNYRI